nr:MAG: major capsid protein [Microviridae sp.]
MTTIKKNLGGDRLGSGSKIDVNLHNYERSTHDQGFIFRTSAAPGTLIPFMTMVGLPGDTFDINLNADCKTLPTIGPLFGSFKMQLDVFKIPMRLYNSFLHNNELQIGMHMERIKIPQIQMECADLNFSSNIPLEQQQINQSCLYAYLGMRGVGKNVPSHIGNVVRQYNAIPLLAYWDIYKNYYANKQEEYGAFINYEQNQINQWTTCIVYSTGNPTMTYHYGQNPIIDQYVWKIEIYANKGAFYEGIIGIHQYPYNVIIQKLTTLDLVPFEEVFETPLLVTYNEDFDVLVFTDRKLPLVNLTMNNILFGDTQPITNQIKIETFQLSNIDEMRGQILSFADEGAPFIIDTNTNPPYCSPLLTTSNGQMYAQYSLESLALKTYQSDIFNNWLQNQWIDGIDGITSITNIDTSEGYFSLDTMLIAKKVYDLLNRVAVSGGSYNDWMQAVYGVKPYNMAESPVYCGGLSKEVIFQEVVSLAQVPSASQPLGTLAGKGVMSKKHKGGHIIIKCEEPSYIMGIVSLTPRIDYSQGNQWDVNLKTFDDLHKPGLDEIGFQDAVTDQFAFWDTKLDIDNNKDFFSAGKQPAWLNYMTNYNKCFGDFADQRKEMFMTLNRRFESNESYRIKDLTTYIDPAKYNYMFAETKIDAQNFWIQIAIDCTSRRKMSAKVMPNL